jgi:hypothetical protein
MGTEKPFPQYYTLYWGKCKEGTAKKRFFIGKKAGKAKCQSLRQSARAEKGQPDGTCNGKQPLPGGC